MQVRNKCLKYQTYSILNNVDILGIPYLSNNNVCKMLYYNDIQNLVGEESYETMSKNIIDSFCEHNIEFIRKMNMEKFNNIEKTKTSVQLDLESDKKYKFHLDKFLFETLDDQNKYSENLTNLLTLLNILLATIVVRNMTKKLKLKIKKKAIKMKSHVGYLDISLNLIENTIESEYIKNVDLNSNLDIIFFLPQNVAKIKTQTFSFFSKTKCLYFLLSKKKRSNIFLIHPNNKRDIWKKYITYYTLNFMIILDIFFKNRIYHDILFVDKVDKYESFTYNRKERIKQMIDFIKNENLSPFKIDNIETVDIYLDVPAIINYTHIFVDNSGPVSYFRDGNSTEPFRIHLMDNEDIFFYRLDKFNLKVSVYEYSKLIYMIKSKWIVKKSKKTNHHEINLDISYLEKKSEGCDYERSINPTLSFGIVNNDYIGFFSTKPHNYTQINIFIDKIYDYIEMKNLTKFSHIMLAWMKEIKKNYTKEITNLKQNSLMFLTKSQLFEKTRLDLYFTIYKMFCETFIDEKQNILRLEDFFIKKYNLKINFKSYLKKISSEKLEIFSSNKKILPKIIKTESVNSDELQIAMENFKRNAFTDHIHKTFNVKKKIDVIDISNIYDIPIRNHKDVKYYTHNRYDESTQSIYKSLIHHRQNIYQNSNMGIFKSLNFFFFKNIFHNYMEHNQQIMLYFLEMWKYETHIKQSNNNKTMFKSISHKNSKCKCIQEYKKLKDFGDLYIKTLSELNVKKNYYDKDCRITEISNVKKFISERRNVFVGKTKIDSFLKSYSKKTLSESYIYFFENNKYKQKYSHTENYLLMCQCEICNKTKKMHNWYAFVDSDGNCYKSHILYLLLKDGQNENDRKKSNYILKLISKAIEILKDVFIEYNHTEYSSDLIEIILLLPFSINVMKPDKFTPFNLFLNRVKDEEMYNDKIIKMFCSFELLHEICYFEHKIQSVIKNSITNNFFVPENVTKIYFNINEPHNFEVLQKNIFNKENITDMNKEYYHVKLENEDLIFYHYDFDSGIFKNNNSYRISDYSSGCRKINHINFLYTEILKSIAKSSLCSWFKTIFQYYFIKPSETKIPVIFVEKIFVWSKKYSYVENKNEMFENSRKYKLKYGVYYAFLMLDLFKYLKPEICNILDKYVNVKKMKNNNLFTDVYLILEYILDEIISKFKTNSKIIDNTYDVFQENIKKTKLNTWNNLFHIFESIPISHGKINILSREDMEEILMFQENICQIKGNFDERMLKRKNYFDNTKENPKKYLKTDGKTKKITIMKHEGIQTIEEVFVKMKKMYFLICNNNDYFRRKTLTYKHDLFVKFWKRKTNLIPHHNHNQNFCEYKKNISKNDSLIHFTMK